jgi:putative SOS response-associated peptidase YedK
VPETDDAQVLQELVRPYPDEEMALDEVSRAVNNQRNNRPELILLERFTVASDTE